MEFFKKILYSTELKIFSLQNMTKIAFGQTSPVLLNRLSLGCASFPITKIPWLKTLGSTGLGKDK